MKKHLTLIRKAMVLIALIVATIWAGFESNQSVALAGVCCSYCDQQDFEICIDKPYLAICQGCYHCNPAC